MTVSPNNFLFLDKTGCVSAKQFQARLIALLSTFAIFVPGKPLQKRLCKE